MYFVGGSKKKKQKQGDTIADAASGDGKTKVCVSCLAGEEKTGRAAVVPLLAGFISLCLVGCFFTGSMTKGEDGEAGGSVCELGRFLLSLWQARKLFWRKL